MFETFQTYIFVKKLTEIEINLIIIKNLICTVVLPHALQHRH